MDPDDDMSIDYAQPLNATDQAGIKEADRLYNMVVGRCFIHPLNSQLYEIMHLYWDQRSKQLAVFRKACYQLADADDRVPYPLLGQRGILRLIESYERNAGYSKAPQWPTSEDEMLALQLACPIVKQYFELLEEPHLARGVRTESFYKHNRVIYQPKYSVSGEDNVIERKGALRAKKHNSTLDTTTVITDINDSEVFRNPVVLPLALRGPLMRFMHDENAHPGATRLLASCQLKYWWRGMTTYISEYASKCQHCKRRNLSHKVAVPPLQRYPGVTRPFQRCHRDLIELPITPSKYRYILVIKCALTK